ncbi:MAG TPA: hypothetical protein VN696_09270 [Pyrinomonadaceae bacterium]|nr:hypothetical protein [Pyrinomonadaceae bacterium]
MSQTKKALIRASKFVVILVLALAVLAGVKTKGQEETASRSTTAAEQWEYLAVAGPSTTNLTPTNNPRMRKEPNVPFAREAFVLEQHLDKLGANGWELVSVAGPATDPAYYFKRRKQ